MWYLPMMMPEAASTCSLYTLRAAGTRGLLTRYSIITPRISISWYPR